MRRKFRGMTDHFAVLHQARRPWLDPDQLRQQYQQLTFTHHPDRGDQDNQQDFASINEAYRVLSNPRLRLHYLLNLESTAHDASVVTSDLTDIFLEIAALVREIDGALQKRERATNALSKSLVETETAALRQRAARLAAKLEDLYQGAEDDLRGADELWTRNPSEVTDRLTTLARRFSYLDRWMNQLKEKQFQLST